MTIRLVINGERIEAPRMMYVPQTGDVIEYTKKGEKEAVRYDVILVHYVYNANNQYSRGDVLIHLKESEPIQLSEEEIKEIGATLPTNEE